MRDKGNLVILIGTLGMTAIMLLSVINQEFTWWVIPFLALFLTLFGSIIWVCCAIYRADRFRIHAHKAYPDQPWMWNKRWQSNVIRSQSRQAFWSTLAFTIILTVFALSGCVAVKNGVPDGNFWTLLGLVPLPFALYCANETWRAWRTFHFASGTMLVLETCPTWIGSRFSAQFHVGKNRPKHPIVARLEFTKIVKHVQHATGGDQEIAYTKVADQKIGCSVEMIPGDDDQTVAFVFADVPPNSPETSWDETDDVGSWDLVVTTMTSQITATLRYEVPVANGLRTSHDTPPAPPDLTTTSTARVT